MDVNDVFWDRPLISLPLRLAKMQNGYAMQHDASNDRLQPSFLLY